MCYQPPYSLFSLDFLCDKASEVHPGFTSSLVLSGFSSLLGILRDVLLPNLPFQWPFSVVLSISFLVGFYITVLLFLFIV